MTVTAGKDVRTRSALGDGVAWSAQTPQFLPAQCPGPLSPMGTSPWPSHAEQGSEGEGCPTRSPAFLWPQSGHLTQPKPIESPLQTRVPAPGSRKEGRKPRPLSGSSESLGLEGPLKIPAYPSDLISCHFPHHSLCSLNTVTFLFPIQDKLLTPGHLRLLFPPLETFSPGPSSTGLATSHHFSLPSRCPQRGLPRSPGQTPGPSSRSPPITFSSCVFFTAHIDSSGYFADLFAVLFLSASPLLA